MRSLHASLIAATLALAGCKAIPLTGDPNEAQTSAHLSAPRVYGVDWWTPLVKTGLLEYQPQETARPLIDPDTERIIVTTRDGYIRSLAPQDGHVEWEVKTGGKFFSGPAIAEGVLYVSCSDGFLRALKASTGVELWKWQANEELVTTPTIASGRVLVASQSETIFSIEAASGKWQWQYRRDAPAGFTVRGAAQPQVKDGLVHMGFADGSLVALGLEDGVQRWERKLTVSSGTQFLDVDSTPVLDDEGNLYAASYKDGIYALSAKTGDVLWNSVRPGITSLVRNGGVLYASGDGSVSAVETKQGRVLWSLDLSDKTSKGRVNNAGRSPMLVRGFLVVPTSTALAFVETSTGRVQMAWNPGRGITATPARSSSTKFGNRLYVLSNLGSLFALQLVGRGG